MNFNSEGLLSYLEEDPFICQDMIDIVRNNLSIKENAVTLNFDLNHTLSPSQIVVSSFMVLSKKCFNIDKTGAGKTIETLASIDYVNKTKNLIIVPSDTMVDQWCSEIFKWLPRGKFRILKVAGEKSSRQQQYQNFNNATTPTILITTYPKCQKDKPQLLPDVLVLDEGTKVKDNTTQTYQSIKNISNTTEYCWILTATPITLSLGDFYWMFQMFNYDYFKTFEEEVEHFLLRSSKHNHSTVIGATDFSSFQERLYPFYIRYDVEDSEESSDAPMPDGLTLNTIPLSISAVQEQLFSNAKKDFLTDSSVGSSIKNFSVFNKIAAIPEIFIPGEFSPKVQYIVDKVLSSDEKSIVYAHYIQEVESIAKILRQKGVSCLIMTGSSSQEQQTVIKNNFVTGTYKVLIMSAVGKFGLNLQSASTMYLLDIPRTASDLEQIVGRVFRRGQTKPVSIFIPYLVNTTDEDRLSILISRQKVLSKFFKLNTDALTFSKSETFKIGFQNKSYKQWRQQ